MLNSASPQLYFVRLKTLGAGGLTSLGLVVFAAMAGCGSNTTTVNTTRYLAGDTGLSGEAGSNAYVSPAAVDIRGACVAPPLEFTLGNVGDGPLTLTALNIEGEYTISDVELPLTVQGGENFMLSLDGSGAGAVEFVTDDPARPYFRVPLSVTLDMPPEVQLLSPTGLDVLAQGETVELSALVVDSVDTPMELTVEWFSSEEGFIGTSIVGLDGRTTLPWEPAMQGFQTVSAVVRDTCGNEVEADWDFCRQGEVLTRPLRSSNWTLSGTSYFDFETETLHITDDELWSIGSGFWMDEVIDASNFTLEFEFYVSGLDAITADGMAVVLLDAERSTATLGPGGGGIGYGAGVEPGDGLPGAAIEIDTSYNTLDPFRNNHVALSFDGRMDSPAYAAEIGAVDDGTWHTIRIEHDAPLARTFIDGVLVAEVEVANELGFSAYLGFSAATGSYTANHWLRDAVLMRPVCWE